MIERFENIGSRKLTPLGVIASFEVAIRSLPDILELIGDELLVGIVVLLSEGWLGPLLGELSMWLLYASLLYLLISRLLPDSMAELSDDRVFRWLFAVATVVFAAGLSREFAELRPNASTGASVGGSEAGIFYVMFVPLASYFIVLSLYFWLVRPEPMQGEAGVLTGLISEDTVQQKINSADSPVAHRVFSVVSDVIPPIVVLSGLILPIGGVVAALSQLYPVPEFLCIGVWLVSTANKRIDRLPQSNIGPADTDLEGVFGQSIIGTLQSKKGRALGWPILFGVVASMLIFIFAIFGVQESIDRIGVQGDILGWSGTVPGPLQSVAHYAIVGSTLTLAVSALCLLWGLFRVAKRAPAFVAAWEQRAESVPGSYPRPDISRPPYGIIPPMLLAAIAPLALFPRVFSTDNYLFQTVYGMLWPLGIVVAGAWIWATLRRAPQPARSDNWIYGTLGAIVMAYAGVLSFAGTNEAEFSYALLACLASGFLIVYYVNDIELVLRQTGPPWSKLQSHVSYLLLAPVTSLIVLLAPTGQRVGFGLFGILLLYIILYFMREHVYNNDTTPMPDSIVREFRSTLDDIEGPVRLLIVERELPETAESTVHRAFQKHRNQWRALDDDESVPTVRATGDDPRPWVAVEPTDGRPLTEAQESLSLSEREAVVTSVVETLQRAADEGIVHDGIRPEHIQVTQSDEQPRIIIDNWVAEAEQDSPYTAPELPETPESRTEQTAVYNVAALAYYALTGSSPTTDDGETDPDEDSPSPPSRHVSEIPSAVDTAVLRGLDPESASRQQSIAEFRDSFVEAVETVEVSASDESTADEADDDQKTATDGQQEPSPRGGSPQFTRREAVSMVGVSGLGVAGYLYPMLGGVNYPHIPDTIEYALHSRTGTLQWSFETGDSVAHAPAVDNGTVFVGCDGGQAYALNAGTGSKEWSVETLSDASSPTASDGTVFVPSNGRLYAMDATDGTEMWQFDVSTLDAPTVVDDTVYVGGDEALAINAETGSTRWSREVPNPTPPAVVSGTAYFGSEEGIYAFDTGTGKRKWLSETGSISWRNGVFGIADNSVFAFGDTEEGTSRVCTVDTDDGTEQWQFEIEVAPTAVFPDSAVVGDETVYVGAGRRVYALDTDGRTRWQFDTEHQVTGTSGTSDQTLYVSTVEESLYAVDITDGSQRWVFRSGADGALNSPTVVDNLLYVGSDDTDRVYAVAVSDI